MFDSHCHIQFPVYDTDRYEVIRRAKEARVKMIVVGTQLSTSEAAIAFSEQFPGDIWAAVGFHPNHLAENWYFDRKEQRKEESEKFDAKRFNELAQHPNVVAVGECGLDYFRNQGDQKSPPKADPPLAEKRKN